MGSGNSNSLADDDNWDNDFATSISASALQLPHLKPQDNFNGLLSTDRLKVFAFNSDSRNVSANYGEDPDGELLTIKAQHHEHDIDPQEQTLRPYPRKSSKTEEHIKSHQRAKSSVSKAAIAGAAAASGKPKSPTKQHFGAKFELPTRPGLAFREQSVEDYSDLCVDNDNVFNKRVNNMVLKKVRSRHPLPSPTPTHSATRETPHNFSTPQTSRVSPGRCNPQSEGA